MTSATVSVVIVNTNHVDLLRQCLTAVVGSQLPANTEIIVVDNCSRDGSGTMVQSEFPMVKLLCQATRNGPAANYNTGFEAAVGDYLVVLNEDAEVEEDTLIKMYGFMENHPEIAVSGPRLTYPDGAPQTCCHRFPKISSVFKRLVLQSVFSGPWVHNQYQQELANTAFEPDWIMATSLMIRRIAMEQTGHYDEQFVIYYEELELCKRLRDKGWKVAWVPEAVVKHHHGVSNFKLKGERDITFRLLLYQSRYRYFAKHYGAIYCGAVRGLEAILFLLFRLKTGLESGIPARRESAQMKSLLYSRLAAYALTLRGCPELPQG